MAFFRWEFRFLAMLILVNPPLSAQTSRSLDWKKIDAAIGAKGAMTETENVYKVTFPRSDVPISVDGRTMEPFLGFTSWVAFQPGVTAECVLMGDLVLFEDEVNPAMSAALSAGVQVTALHNHFFFDSPRVYFMHLGGEGKAEDLAAGVRSALDAAQVSRSRSAQPQTSSGLAPVPETSSIPAEIVDVILGVKGQVKDGMYKAVIGRSVTMTACGCTVAKDMGVNTWAAFAGTQERALVDGDFAVLEGELQVVLKTLRSAGINIVAIHHHMVGETPRMLFVHYWGTDTVENLARGVKSALEAQRAVDRSKRD